MEELLNSYLMQSGEEGHVPLNSRLNDLSGQRIVGFSDFVEQSDNPEIDRGRSDPSTDEELPIILLDLETSGLGRGCEILQIAAKLGTKVFGIYVRPEKPISGYASQANGLTCDNGVLRYYGNPVQSVSLMIAMKSLLSWLTSFDKQCYVATHNLSFDGPRLYDAILSCDLRNDFSKVIYGFIDTLHVIRKVTGRKGKGLCTIGGLAEWLNVSSDGAHNALCDVEILGEILQKANIGYEKLIPDAKTYFEQFDKWDNDKYVKGVLPSLDPLKVVVGENIRKKMVMASITIEQLKDVYANSGQQGLEELLSREVDGKPLVTRQRNKIVKIGRWISMN